MLPPPLLYSLGKNSHLLVSEGRVYQPSRQKSEIFLINARKRKLYLEPSETLDVLDDLYDVKFSKQKQRFKKQYLEQIIGITNEEISRGNNRFLP